jgi:stearoyl-CoA desaturase (Delta-9 desaturase)
MQTAEMQTAPRANGPALLRLKTIPFLLVHLGAVGGVAWLGWSWRGAALAVALYFGRMFFITGGYHRYFSHRSFKTSRAMQLVFAVFAMSSSQKGVLWWAGHHRTHHKLSDLPGDVHSAARDGFLWSHLSWIFSEDYEDTDIDKIKDFNKYPELRWLNRYWALPPAALAVVLFAIGGPFALVWGFFVSTTILWHGTFTINSLTHVFGSRRYATTDNSRNNGLLALITMGEGWHNNHHYYQRSANQGFFWWEVDPTFYVLRAMQALGLIWDLHAAPAHVVEGGRVAVAAPVLVGGDASAGAR